MTSTGSNVAALQRLRGALDPARRPDRLSASRFDETHELFERSSSQQRLILDWLAELILERYASIDPLKILSVGCGSGILDIPLIRSIASSSRRIEYTGLDPNPVACRRFRESFDDQEFPNVRLDLREQDVESIASGDRFHIIHVVHSLYYFDDPAKTLDLLPRLLAPGGRIVVVQAPEAELNQLANCFWGHHENDDIWFSDRLDGHLSQHRLPFSRRRIDGDVDVARCFVADCPRGAMMLDFITQSDCRQLDDEIMRDCLGYLRSISRRDNGNLLVAHPADAFVIDPGGPVHA